jgi:hypothetical protein
MPDPIRMTDDKAERMTAIIVDDIRQAESDLSGYRSQVAKGRKKFSYEQVRTDMLWQNGSNLVIPFVQQTYKALLAHIVPALLSVDPIYAVDGPNNAFALTDRFERFYARQWEIIKLRRMYERWYGICLMDGGGALMPTWRIRRQMRPQMVRVSDAFFDEDGEILAENERYQTKEMPVTVYDAPHLQVLTVDQYGLFPAAFADIEDSPGAWVTNTLSGETIAQRMHQGLYRPDAVHKLFTSITGTTDDADPSDVRYGITGSGGDTDPNALRKTYRLTEAFWLHGDATIGDDGKPSSKNPLTLWQFTLDMDQRLLLAARPLPWSHGKIPLIIAKPYSMDAGIGGESIVTTGAGQVQDGLTSLMNLAIDAVKIGIAPELLVSAEMGEDINRLLKRRGPGGMIPFPQSYFEKPWAMPFGQGSDPSRIMPFVEYLTQTGNMDTGASDQMKDSPSPGGITATEAEQIVESTQKMVAYITEHLAMAQDEAGEMLHDLTVQFQSNDGPQRVWRETAANPDDPLTLADALAQGPFHLRTNGIRTTSNKAILANRAMQAYGLLAQEPMVVSNTQRRYNLLSRTLSQGLQVRNPADLMGTAEEWAQEEAMQQQMMQQQAQMQLSQADQLEQGATGDSVPLDMAGNPQQEMMGNDAAIQPPTISQFPGADGLPGELPPDVLAAMGGQ